MSATATETVTVDGQVVTEIAEATSAEEGRGTGASGHIVEYDDLMSLVDRHALARARARAHTHKHTNTHMREKRMITHALALGFGI